MAPRLNLPDPAHPSDPLYGKPVPPPGYIINKYIGDGGFGTVWEGEAPGGIPCALKFMPLTQKVKATEARAILKMRGVRSGQLVPLFGIWLRDPSAHILNDAAAAGAPLSAATEIVIAMGLGTGTLLDVLKKYRGPQGNGAGIPTDILLDYMGQAAKAIDFLNSPEHELGDGSKVAIYHCDIKPENILTIPGGGIWVCDFGIARFRRPESVKHSMADHQLGLTLQYAAPELIHRPTNDYSAEDYKNTDQYSLAITYYHLRTGTLPFRPEDATAPLMMMAAHVQGRLDFGGVPEPEVAVLRKATEPNQNDRFPSALDMVGALGTAVGPSEGRWRQAKSTAEIRVATRVWLPKEGLEIVPGYRLRKLRTLGPEVEDLGDAWESEAPDGGRAVLQIVWPLAGDPGPACRALDRLREVRHEGLAQVLGRWLLDAEGKVLADDAGGNARALVVATRTAAYRSLLQRLDDVRHDGRPGLPRDELLEYLARAAASLDHLHGPGLQVQHGDVRPENMNLLDSPGQKPRVVLTHFSLARLVEGERTAIPKEQGGPGAIYRPPESLDGQRTPSCDQYGLAVTYYHLRTGRLPRAAYGAPYVMAEAIRAGQLGLDDLPGPEREVVEQATDRDPGRRFATCADLVRALKKCPELPLETSAPLRQRAASAVTITPIVTSPPQKSGLPGLFPTQTPTDTGVKPPDEEPPQTSPRPPARGPAAPPESDWNLSLLDSNYTTQPPLNTLTRDDDPGVDEEEALEEIHEPGVHHRGGAGQQASGRAKRLQEFIPTVIVALVLAVVVLGLGMFLIPYAFPTPQDKVQRAVAAALKAVHDENFELCQNKLNEAIDLGQKNSVPTDRARAIKALAEEVGDTSRHSDSRWLTDFGRQIEDALPANHRDDGKPFEDLREKYADEWVENKVGVKLRSDLDKEGAIKGLRDAVMAGLDVVPSASTKTRLEVLLAVADRARAAKEKPSHDTLRVLREAAGELPTDEDRRPFQDLRAKLANEQVKHLLDETAKCLGSKDTESARAKLASTRSLAPSGEVESRTEGLKAALNGFETLIAEKDESRWEEAKKGLQSMIARTVDLTASDRAECDKLLASLPKPILNEEGKIGTALAFVKDGASEHGIDDAISCLKDARSERAKKIWQMLMLAKPIAFGLDRGLAPEEIKNPQAIKNKVEEWRDQLKDLREQVVKAANLGQEIAEPDRDSLFQLCDYLERQWKGQVAWAVGRAAVDGVPAKDDRLWEAWHGLAEEFAESTVLVRAFQAEFHDRRNPGEKAVKKLLGDLSKDDDYRGVEPKDKNVARDYVCFVRARLAERLAEYVGEGEKRIYREAAADDLTRVEPEWAGGPRGQECRSILMTAVKKHPAAPDTVRPFTKGRDAKHVGEWLDKAMAIQERQPVGQVDVRERAETLAYRIMAAWSEPPEVRDNARVREWTNKLRTKAGSLDSARARFAVLIAYADSRSEGEKDERINAYVDAMKEVSSAVQAEDTHNIPRGDVGRYLLQRIGAGDNHLPQSVAPDEKSVDQRARLAELCAALALDIQSQAAEWEGVAGIGKDSESRSRLVVGLFDKAARLEKECEDLDATRKQGHRKQRAEYVVGRINERLTQVHRGDSLNGLLTEAEEACALADKREYSGAHSLKWVIQIRIAEEMDDRAKRVEVLKDAESDFREMLLHPPDKGSRAADFLHYCRSVVFLHLGNWETDQLRVKEYLTQARDSAEMIASLNYVAWRQRGNANEDVAWLVWENSRRFEDYKKALDAFGEASILNPKDDIVRMGRGRVLVKWAQHMPGAQFKSALGHLDEADAYLRQVDRNPDAPEVTKMEACFWLASSMIRRWELDKTKGLDREELDRTFGRALDLAHGASSDWPETILVKWIEFSLREKRFKTVENCARKLDSYKYHTRAAWCRGRMYFALEQFADALEEFDKGLRAEHRVQDAPIMWSIHQDRLNARHELLFTAGTTAREKALANIEEDMAAANSRSNNAERAMGLGLAGRVYWALWTFEPTERNKARALGLLEDAIGRDTGEVRIDPYNGWRVKAAQLLKDSDPTKSQRYVNDAITYTRNHDPDGIPALKKRLKGAAIPDEWTTD
jgi:serine/threonine protein kinase